MDTDAAVSALAAGRDWQAVVPVKAGWSSDAKYRVTDASGSQFMLRVAPGDQLDRKRFEYRCLERVAGLNILSPDPIEFGTCCDGRFVYALLGWVVGTDAADVLPRLSGTEQYELGVIAGAALGSIHTLDGDLGGESWDAYYTRKIERVLAKYEACTVRLPQGDEVIRFVRAGIRRLSGRPIRLQHLALEQNTGLANGPVASTDRPPPLVLLRETADLNGNRLLAALRIDSSTFQYADVPASSGFSVTTSKGLSRAAVG